MAIADIRELGTIMSIWAHPDDEAYLCGGIMAQATAAGSRVVCVTATRGELGVTDPAQWPPEQLAAIRTTLRNITGRVEPYKRPALATCSWWPTPRNGSTSTLLR
jgi:hypothetical protein